MGSMPEMLSATRWQHIFPKMVCYNISQVNHAMMIWWNFFTVLDVMLLVIYRQLREDLSPKAVFYINNVIWFFGLDLYHLYFTIYLWMKDVPTLKEVPRRIVFYPSKPTRLEPRRPEHCEQFENQDKLSDDFEDQNLSTMMALLENSYSSCSSDQSSDSESTQPGNLDHWGGRGEKPKQKVIYKSVKAVVESYPRNDLPPTSGLQSTSTLPPVTD